MSDYVVGIAWTRPWDVSSSMFRPDAITLLPYLGQLTSDSDKTVELFYTGYIDRVPDDVPVYYLDESCIISIDIQSAQPPVTDIQINREVKYSDISFSFSAEGGYYSVVISGAVVEVVRHPAITKVVSCVEEGVSAIPTQRGIAFSDKSFVSLPDLSSVASPDLIDYEDWGYTSEQFNAMVAQWPQPIPSQPSPGWYYNPVGVTSNAVLFLGSGFILICDRKTMKVKTQFSTGLSSSFEPGYFCKIPQSSVYEGFALLPKEQGNSILCLVHNVQTDAWSVSRRIVNAPSGTIVSNYTYAKQSEDDATYSLVVCFSSSNGPYYNLFLVGIRFRTPGILMLEEKSSSISIIPVTTSYEPSGTHIYDVLVKYWSDVSTELSILAPYKVVGKTQYKILFVRQFSSTQLELYASTFDIDSSDEKYAGFLGLYPYIVESGSFFMPFVSDCIFWNSQGDVEYRTNFGQRVASQHSVSDFKYRLRDVDKIVCSFIDNITSNIYVAMVYGYDPFEGFVLSSESRFISVAEGEQNVVKLPGVVENARFNRVAIDIDKGRVSATVQKVGYSKGLYSGDDIPVNEVSLDKLPLLAIGAYVKVFPSGSYGHKDKFITKITRYSLRYNGVTTATVEGIIVGKELSPESTVYEYACSMMPDWTWSDDCKLFIWVWGGIYGSGDWVQAIKTSSTSCRFIVARQQITGFKVCRCHKDTTVPYWNQQGDTAGRIYNVSADINCNNNQFVYLIGTLYDYYPN